MHPKASLAGLICRTRQYINGCQYSWNQSVGAIESYVEKYLEVGEEMSFETRMEEICDQPVMDQMMMCDVSNKEQRGKEAGA